MRRIALTLACLTILACGSKPDAPIVDYIPPQPADEPTIMLVVPEQQKPDNDVYVTVIATGFGDTERAALADARREAVLAAAEIALEKGDAYIDDFKKIIDNLPSREAEFVKEVRKVAGRDQAVEVAAKVNYTKLTDAINALNAVVYRLPLREAPSTTAIESDEAKKERLLKEFAGIFGDLNDVMTVKIESIDYNQAQAKDGMIPFQINFILLADPQKYQRKVLQMIDIVTKELGGSLVGSAPVDYVAPNKYDLGYYRAPLDKILNERMYAAVLNRNGKDIVEIYRLSEHYRRFFNDAYAAEKVIGSPKAVQLRLRLENTSGDVMYEDFIEPFTFRTSNRKNLSELEGIYPAIYIVNKHEKLDYDGRFRLGSYHASLFSAIRLEVRTANFRENIINDQFSGKYPYKWAVTAPYILAYIGFNSNTYSTKELKLQYEGLISISDVKKLKSVTIETVK